MTPPRSAFVEVDIYSGLRNPTWSLTPAAAAEFKRLLQELPVTVTPSAIDEYDQPYWRPHGGYRGIEITFVNPESPARRETFIIFDRLVLDVQSGVFRNAGQARTLEERLYNSAPGAVLAEQLGSKSFAMVTQPAQESPIQGLEGPDVGLICPSSPDFVGNTGGFATHRLINNCYSYATNVLNKNKLQFGAMPGSPDLTQPVTMAKLQAAIDDDTLVSFGTKLPAQCPPAGAHYLVVVFRQTTDDFHCLRLDRNGAWSHKDGKSTIRKADDKGKKITDLTKAVFHCNPVLAGIYLMHAAAAGNIK